MSGVDRVDFTDPVSVLAELIRYPSVNPPGREGPLALAVKEMLAEIGMEVELQEVLPDRPNVIGRKRWGDGGKRLLLNTHLDVNPPGDLGWTSDPFIPRLEGDRLYGRGSADAKGSAAAMIAAVARLLSRRADLRGELIFTGVMGEETSGARSGGLGSAHLVRQGIKADAAIVGEPTELQVMITHKGNYRPKILIKGITAHSSSPEKGVNAITLAADFVKAVDSFGQALKSRPHPLAGPPTLSVTMISGGLKINTIPGYVELVLDRRLVPGEDFDMARREIEGLLRQVAAANGKFSFELMGVQSSAVPAETPESAEIVKVALAAAAEILGRPQKAAGFPGGCDMRHLVNTAGIPTVILGPGSLAQAHAPDEYVEIRQLIGATEIYQRTALKMLTR